ncbi:MAG: hypothetical protein AAF399_01070 [Bacteroidota bacterium]
MRPFFHICLLFLSAGLLIHCNEVKQVILPHTELIFPMEEGHYRISEVWDTTFTTAGINDPMVDHYFKKEVLAAQDTDLIGRPIRLVEVYRSEADLGTNYDFQIDRVWYQYLEPVEGADYYAERVVENVRTQVLKFPVIEGVRWNGNLQNNLGSEIFFYDKADSTVSVQSQMFENCVVVFQNADSLNVINRRLAYEAYAPEIGLVKKLDRTLVFDGPGGGDAAFNPDKSRIYREELIEHN